MKKQSDLSRQIANIINDKTSGSTDLLLNLNSLVIKKLNDERAVRLIIDAVKKELLHFGIISNYISELEKLLRKNNPELIKDYLIKTRKSAASVKDIYARAKPYLKNKSVVLTLSFSRTVTEFLKQWKKDLPELKVIIAESRPKFEGRKTAEELLKVNINCELITDASIGIFIQQCDMVLSGADIILKNKNVVNKAGSLVAAVLCREFSKPFCVVAQKEKYSGSLVFKQKEQSVAEVWNKKHRVLKVRNLYFEEISRKYITRIFS
jgi:translation initiation factor 2B subunit (eIF-2B alpha/beta/delta family)